MATIDTSALISITNASKLGVSALVREAEAGRVQVVLRNNRPVAAVVSMKRLEELQELQENLIDVSVAAARMMTTGPERYSLDDVLAQFGYTREQLLDADE